jgi:hypothetical protein
MYFQPEMVYYIYSSETKRELSYLLSLTSIPHESIEVSASDLQGIRSIAVGLSDRISLEDEVTLNLQGGTKHWSLIFYSVFSKFDNCSLYLLDQNNVLANLNTLDLTLSKEIFTNKAYSISINLSAKNLLNCEYELVSGYPMPGRSLLGGMGLIF